MGFSLSGALSGAGAGSKLGGWGALAGGVLGGLFGGDDNAPQGPNYYKLARQQSNYDWWNNIQSQFANNVNQQTPYGSVQFTPTITGRDKYNRPIYSWTQKVGLTSEQQDIFDRNQLADLRLSGSTGNLGKEVWSQSKNPLNFDGIMGLGTPGDVYNKASDAAYENAMRYVEPRMQREQAGLENQLANQGITRGSEAWNAAMADQTEKREGVYSAAQNQSYLSGLQGAGQMWNQLLQGRNQGIDEAQTLRYDPINYINAIRGGGQLGGTPQVGASTPGRVGQVQSPDLMTAGQNQYQAQLDRYNADQVQKDQMFSGLYGIAQNWPSDWNPFKSSGGYDVASWGQSNLRRRVG